METDVHVCKPKLRRIGNRVFIELRTEQGLDLIAVDTINAVVTNCYGKAVVAAGLCERVLTIHEYAEMLEVLTEAAAPAPLHPPTAQEPTHG